MCSNMGDLQVFLRRGGYLKYSKAFDMTSYIRNEEDYVPWKTAILNWAYIEKILSPAGPAYKLLQVSIADKGH